MLIWFTSFSNAPTILVNKRNIAIELIGLIFLMCRNDVVVPRRVTEEPTENVFGSYRMQKRELSALEMINMEINRREK